MRLFIVKQSSIFLHMRALLSLPLHLPGLDLTVAAVNFRLTLNALLLHELDHLKCVVSTPNATFAKDKFSEDLTRILKHCNGKEWILETHLWPTT